MPPRPRPWLRLYTEVADNQKVHDLPDRLVKPWLIMLAVSGSNTPRGRLPSFEKVAFKLRVKEEKAKAFVAELVTRRFIDYDGAHYVMHEWDEWQKDRDVAPSNRADKSRVNHGNGDDSVTKITLEEEEEKEQERDQEKDGEKDEEAPPRRNIFVLYDNFMGKLALTPTLRELLIEAEDTYPAHCIEHCFQEAAASSDGRRSWKFVESILIRHATEGCNGKPRLQAVGSGNGRRSGSSTIGPAEIDDLRAWQRGEID